MSFQNTIKCMKKYNYVVHNHVEGLKTSREEEAVKQCFQLNEILNNMKNVNFENIEHFDAETQGRASLEETINSPRILNLKQKKEELELKIASRTKLEHKPRKPNKPIPKIINSKIANINK